MALCFGYQQQQQTFIKPAVPFKGLIKGGLYEGKTITVAGRVMPGATRFHVNLMCGSGENADIALHFNPRYESFFDVVVCNTKQHSQWGPEERNSPVPMARGADFTLQISVNRDSFMLIVNGAVFMQYMHRLSVSRVDTIAVDGGLEVHTISFQNPPGQQSQNRRKKEKSHKATQQWCNATATQSFLSALSAPGYGFSPVPPPYSPPTSLAVPYKNIMAGGLYPGRNITIQGMVNNNADRFCFNLRFNSGIAFHFNPRFDENVVVRNTLLQDNWGPEERTGGMPFSRGQGFMVTISCDAQHYKVFVNGVHTFSYNHRHFALQQVDIVEVEGDVSLSSVVF